MDQHRFFAHVPLVMLEGFSEQLAHLPIGLELLIDHEALAPAFEGSLDRLAEGLLTEGRPLRFHAPFRDLHPAGHDPEAVDLARRRLAAALELAPRFGVHDLVAHPAWDPEGDRLDRADWLARAEAFWLEMGERAAERGCRFALENIFDRDPSLLGELLDRLPAARFGVNFDVGHWHAYSQAPLGVWLERLGPRLLSVHLHDNRGGADEHLRLGEGAIAWDTVFAGLRTLGRPLEWTVENRSLRDVIASAAFLGRRGGIPALAGLSALAPAPPASAGGAAPPLTAA